MAHLNKDDIAKKLKGIEQSKYEEWINTINIWDTKYDSVMHNDHWLTSDWSDSCELCLKSQEPINLLITPLKPLMSNGSSHDVSPPKIHEALIPVTPIAPTNVRTQAFVTPYSTNKLNGTFSCVTRQTTQKLLNQTQDNPHLISLSDTYDLYTSALAETPETETESRQGPLFPERNHQELNQAHSRIPRIPVKVSKP